jgi:hypothetical protein
MIEQLGNSLRFYAHFVASKVGKTGLTVTVDVYESGTAIVTGASATEVGTSGVYIYVLAGASVDLEGEYLAVFKTADATVDQQHVPSLWVVGRAGLEDLDAAISSRLAAASYTAPPSASTVAQAVWDALTSALVAAGSIGEWILSKLDVVVSTRLAASSYTAPPSAAAVSDAVWDEAVSDHLTAGTTGAVLGSLGSAELVVLKPAFGDAGVLSLVRGDTYAVDENRALAVSSETWPDLTGADPITLTIRRRPQAFRTDPTDEDVLLSVTDVLSSRVFGPSGDQTVVFEIESEESAALLPGLATGKYDVQATLSNGHVFTLVFGLVNVVEDQTR